MVALPAPGTMVALSPTFQPPVLRGITVYPNEPFKFEFIVDSGEAKMGEDELKAESDKLIKYFLAALTVPEKDLWVNLSPYEKERIIPEEFSTTEMGRDLLGQDYILKQLTASLIYPEEDLGKSFWDKIYAKANELYGTTNIPVNTFNKVWIVPEKAIVYEDGPTAFITESRLKVMLEEDYLSLNQNSGRSDLGMDQLEKQDVEQISDVSSAIVKEIILPEIEHEVNTGKNFAPLRQIYHSLILAAWFKRNLKESVLGKIYMDQNKVEGIDLADKEAKEKIYAQYIEAFKKGVYDYIREDYDPAKDEMIPRKYFAGGTSFAGLTEDQTKLETRNAHTEMGRREFLRSLKKGSRFFRVGSETQPVDKEGQPISLRDFLNGSGGAIGLIGNQGEVVGVDGTVLQVRDKASGEVIPVETFEYEGDSLDEILNPLPTLLIRESQKHSDLLVKLIAHLQTHAGQAQMRTFTHARQVADVEGSALATENMIVLLEDLANNSDAGVRGLAFFHELGEFLGDKVIDATRRLTLEFEGNATTGKGVIHVRLGTAPLGDVELTRKDTQTIIQNRTTDYHYLLRALQREFFGEVDVALTDEIKGLNKAVSDSFVGDEVINSFLRDSGDHVGYLQDVFGEKVRKPLLEYRTKLDQLAVEEKDFGEIVTEADHTSQRNLLNAIWARWPGHRVIAEEVLTEEFRRKNEENKDSPFVWVIDPLDGTGEFRKSASQEYGVPAVLFYKGHPVMGIFIAPEYKGEQGTVITAVMGKGVFVNGKRVQLPLVASDNNAVAYQELPENEMSHVLPAERYKALARMFGHVKTAPTSTSLDIARILLGEVRVVNHPWLKLWDSVLAAFVEMAGGSAVYLDGSNVYPLAPEVIDSESHRLPQPVVVADTKNNALEAAAVLRGDEDKAAGDKRVRIASRAQLEELLSARGKRQPAIINISGQEQEIDLQVPNGIDLNEEISDVTFVFDIDSTLATDVMGPIDQENLDQIIRAFKLVDASPQERKVKFILYTGTSYKPYIKSNFAPKIGQWDWGALEEEAGRGVVQRLREQIFQELKAEGLDPEEVRATPIIRESVQQRGILKQIQQALEDNGLGAYVGNVMLKSLSGVETVTFNEESRGWDYALGEDESKVFAAQEELEIAKALTTVFLQKWGEKENRNFDSFIQRIQAAPSFFTTDGIEGINEIFKEAVQGEDIRLQVVNFEVNVIFQSLINKGMNGAQITQEAMDILRKKGVLDPGKKYFLAGGVNYSKIDLTSKGNELTDSIAKGEIDTRQGVIVSGGDSTADDFLWLDGQKMMPFYFGRRQAMANFGNVIVALNENGEDHILAQGSGHVMRNVLDVMETGGSWGDVEFLNNRFSPNEIIRGLERGDTLQDVGEEVLPAQWDEYVNKQGLADFPELLKLFTPELKRVLIDDSSLRPVFMQVLSGGNVGKIEVPEFNLQAVMEKVNDEPLIIYMERYSSFLVGNPKVANELLVKGKGKIIIGVTDRYSEDRLYASRPVANGRQAYFPLPDGTWLGVKGSGQFNDETKPPQYWNRDYMNERNTRHEGVAREREVQRSIESMSVLKDSKGHFVQFLGYRRIMAFPDGEGNLVTTEDLQDERDGSSLNPVLIFNRVGTPHRLSKLPHLVKNDPGLNRLRQEISFLMAQKGVIPKDTVLSASDLLLLIMERRGRTEAIKQNERLFKRTIHSQDITLTGEETDNEEFHDFGEYIVRTKRGLTMRTESEELLTFYHISIAGLISVIDILSSIMEGLLQDQKNIILPSPAEAFERLFKSYFASLDDEYLNVWATGKEVDGDVRSLPETYLYRVLQKFHPKSSGSPAYVGDLEQEMQNSILLWAQQEVELRKNRDKRARDSNNTEASVSQDKAASSDMGGIDLNPNIMDLETRGRGADLEIPMDPEVLKNLQIDGLVPVIINIVPITNIQMLLLGEGEDEIRSPDKEELSWVANP